MAVTKTLTKAVPHVKSSKVEKWDLEMKYENDSEGDATYYTSNFNATVENVDPVSGATVFSKKAKGSWTKSELEGICPTSQWDAIFASQVDSVITNPPSNPVPDKAYTIPS
tara:strand:- start:6624 stop:6956 length:333 start_codon:yes stop_codon:yes gene_type:complete